MLLLILLIHLPSRVLSDQPVSIGDIKYHIPCVPVYPTPVLPCPALRPPFDTCTQPSRLTRPPLRWSHSEGSEASAGLDRPRRVGQARSSVNEPRNPGETAPRAQRPRLSPDRPRLQTDGTDGSRRGAGLGPAIRTGQCSCPVETVPAVCVYVYN